MGLPVTRVISRITLQVGAGRGSPPGEPGAALAGCAAAAAATRVVSRTQSASPRPAGRRRQQRRRSHGRHRSHPLLHSPGCEQEILADACREIAGDGVIQNSVHIVDYEQAVDPATGRKTVTAIAEDGRRFSGDLLVGADGIWSKVGAGQPLVPRRRPRGSVSSW